MNKIAEKAVVAKALTISDADRKLVASGRMNILSIRRDNNYDGSGIPNYFITTDKTGTSVHQGLGANDQNPLFGQGGTFIVGEDYIISRCNELGIKSVDLALIYFNARNGETPSILNFDVEERIVGTQVLDAAGKVITTFRGPQREKLANGEAYHQAVNYMIEPSDSLLAKVENFAEKVCLQQQSVNAVSFIPRRRRTIVAPAAQAEETVDSKAEVATALGK